LLLAVILTTPFLYLKRAKLFFDVIREAARLWFSLNVLKDKTLLKLANDVKRVSEMDKFVTLWGKAMSIVPERDSESILQQLDGSHDRGELLKKLNDLGGTKKLNGESPI
jgi:hypothetical protein